MDIGCQVHHTDLPYICSHYSPQGGASSSPLQSHRLNRCCSPLTGEQSCRLYRSGQTAVVDGMSRAFDTAGCTAWVLSGRPHVSDISESSSCHNDQQQNIVGDRRQNVSRTYQRQVALSEDELDPCPVFDVQRQRRVRQTPASVGHLNVSPSSVHAARLIDVDQHDGHEPYISTTAARPRQSGTSKQQWSYIEHQQQHDRSSPETLVSSRLDLSPMNNYRCPSSKCGSQRYNAYDYNERPNVNRCNGSELLDATCNNGPDSGGIFCRGYSTESSDSITVTSQSISYCMPHSSSPRLDVTATVSPRLEAHQLSLSCASVPLAVKTLPRSASTSSSSSSSSTPNIIRRRLKTFSRLAALGGGRSSDPARSRTSRHGHKKQTLTRSTSEPEAIDRDDGVDRRSSSANDEFGFSSSCPNYRVRALRDQQDDGPPSATSFVGRSQANGGRDGRERLSLDDTRTPSKGSTNGGKTTRSTTKAGPRLTMTQSSLSMMNRDNALPKLRRGWSESDGLLVAYPTSILQLTDDEQHQLAKIAVIRLQALDLPSVAAALKQWSRGGMGGISAMKKLRQLKRYVRSGNAFGSGYLRDIGKDKNKCTDTMAEPGSGSGGKSRVFGVSLSDCLRLDAERNQRPVPVSPSSEPNLLEALSLQSAHTSRVSLTSRLSAQQLYDEHYCSTLLHVPYIVRTCCRHLKTHGLDAPGIFRVAGLKSRITLLRQEFDSIASVHLTSEHGVHDVASLLKAFLRDLPEPLLTHELFEAFLATAAIDEVNSRVSTLRLLVALLPTVNRDTLWYLLTFLSCVSKHSDDQFDDSGQAVPGNKMDSSNLATVFGPNVLRRGKTGKFHMESVDEMALNADVVSVVKDLIDFHPAIFRLTKELYNEVLDGLSESGTLSSELDVTAESADSSHLRVQLETADSSEESVRTSLSGYDADCPSSAGDVSAPHQQFTCSSSSSVISPDVTASSRSCLGNGVDDWTSQRWRHWQQITMRSCCESNEQQTLV